MLAKEPDSMNKIKNKKIKKIAISAVPSKVTPDLILVQIVRIFRDTRKNQMNPTFN